MPWQDRMRGLPYTVTDVAVTAGLAADNVQKIMDGRNPNYQKMTKQRILQAIEFLRDRCPTCHRSGLADALAKSPRHEFDRSAAERAEA